MEGEGEGVCACCFVTSGGRELLLAGEKWQFYRQSEPSDKKILCVSVSVSLCNSENRDFPIEKPPISVFLHNNGG